MRTIDMTRVYRLYRGKWVAMENPEAPRVIASGKTLKETLELAKKRGASKPVVTQIPKEILPTVGRYQ